MMGIGTLIIFIASILVAAVAAAVMISTSNVLQQRSLLVGQEARKTITDGVDVFSITANSNATTETFNDFEVLVRLSPGSDPLQMKKFDIEFLANRNHAAATLNYYEGQNEYVLGSVVGTATCVNIGVDLDDDGRNDCIILLDGGAGAVDALRVNLTYYGLSDNITVGSVDGNAFTVREAPIRIGNDDVFGSVEISDSGSGIANEISADSITIRRHAITCDFQFLPPENYFCYQVMIGNNDYVLDSREKYKILYRLREENALTVGDDILFIFSSEKGRLTETRARTPDVVTLTKTRIWPLG